MTEDEKFFAWLDGELEPQQAAEMEAKVLADPALARLLDEHRALEAQLKGAFDPIAGQPVPKHLQAALRPSAQVIDLARAKRAPISPSRLQWMAMAATLALGVFLGTMIPQRSAAPVEVHGGKLYAAALLNRALNTELASAPAGAVRIGITFRSRTGEICRTFTARSANGLACRAGGEWAIKGLFAGPEGQASDYRMAAGMDPNLAELVDSTIRGEAFDADHEKAAMDRGWK